MFEFNSSVIRGFAYKLKQTQGVEIMRRLLAVVFLTALSACASVQVAEKANPVVSVRCVYPVITPLAETKELQTKGGINISLAPNTFSCSDAVKLTRREVSSNIFNFEEQMPLMRLINQNGGLRPGNQPENYQLLETTATPVYAVNPNKVAFRIKINNQMPRVFRGAGTVVLYNFGGKNTSISSQEYSELSNIIVPPRTEAEVVIYGPPFQDVKENTTLGVFLYDVVTNTDNAGNILEKQNFEWYYNYTSQVKEAERAIKTEKVWVRR